MRAEDKNTAGTHIVPILLAERDGRRSALDACTVDKDVNLATHGIQGFLEKRAHRRQVREIAVDDLYRSSEFDDRVVRVKVRVSGTLHETDSSARLGERDSTVRADACRAIAWSACAVTCKHERARSRPRRS